MSRALADSSTFNTSQLASLLGSKRGSGHRQPPASLRSGDLPQMHALPSHVASRGDLLVVGRWARRWEACFAFFQVSRIECQSVAIYQDPPVSYLCIYTAQVSVAKLAVVTVVGAQLPLLSLQSALHLFCILSDKNVISCFWGCKEHIQG